jgi:hypothetical protein
MDFLTYSDVSFGSGVDMGLLCKKLDQIVGLSICYDTFKVENTKWLWFVNDVVKAMNNDKVLCGVFCLYPSYVAGTLNKVQEINFYVLSNNKLKYSDYIEKCISGKQCTISYKSYDGNYFKLSSSEGTVDIRFQTRIMDGKLPSVLTFAYSVINQISLSCLAYGIVSIDNHVTYVTDEVLTSRHECVIKSYWYLSDFDVVKRLANCKYDKKSCLQHPYKNAPFSMSLCTMQSHRRSWDPRCDCKLCVKNGPASLKSLCVNKLGYLLAAKTN